MAILRRTVPFALALLAVGLVASRLFAAGTTARVEVPISERRLSDGNLRYSVPVRIGGGSPIEAMLDTGSFGLRVMADAVSASQYQSLGIVRRYRFGSGVVLEGPLANAVVSIGNATTGEPVTIQVIQSITCTAVRPNCPAARLGAADYRIGGDGLAGEGFQAILGLSMRRPDVETAALNPLDFVGAREWIVTLPKPGDRAPGKLIINPNAADLAGFQLFRVELTPPGGAEEDGHPMRENLISACIGTQTAAATDEACGPMKLDTGARDGLQPFFSYSILYDQTNGAIGFKRR